MGEISVAVFDVNETLSDMTPMRARFTAVGAPEWAAQLWFASLLRDGFALTAAGSAERFAVLAADGLRRLLSSIPAVADVAHAVETVMTGFSELGVHADVADGIRALSEAGLRLITLSNGGPGVAERLLGDTGLRDRFEAVLSVEDAGAWKPSPAAYHYAARCCAVPPAAMVLVAVHPWDIHGAAAAGLSTAWLDREREDYPAYFHRPTWRVGAIAELTDLL